MSALFLLFEQAGLSETAEWPFGLSSHLIRLMNTPWLYVLVQSGLAALARLRSLPCAAIQSLNKCSASGLMSPRNPPAQTKRGRPSVNDGRFRFSALRTPSEDGVTGQLNRDVQLAPTAHGGAAGARPQNEIRTREAPLAPFDEGEAEPAVIQQIPCPEFPVAVSFTTI